MNEPPHAAEQVDACFHAFDKDDSGVLDKEEFRSMIESTVNVNLRYLVATEGSAVSVHKL